MGEAGIAVINEEQKAKMAKLAADKAAAEPEDGEEDDDSA
jgi:hypothetical protein